MPTITFTIPANTLAESMTNLPVLLNLGAASGLNDVDTTQIFADLGTNWQKIHVLDSAAAECAVEMERWDDANSTAQLWVKIPTVNATGDTVVTLNYDPLGEDSTYIGTTGSAAGKAVWSDDYLVVYHLSQNPTGGAGCMLDSGPNSLHLTPSGSHITTGAALVNGPVGKALLFNGSPNYLYRNHDAGFVVSTGLHLDALIYANSASRGGLINKMKGGTPYEGYLLCWGYSAGKWNIWSKNTAGAWNMSTETCSTATWYSLSGHPDAYFRNGAADGTPNQDNIPADDGAAPFQLGRDYAVNYFSGRMREVRVSNKARSLSYAKATHLSNIDQLLVVFTVAYVTVRAELEQLWGDYIMLSSPLEQTWGIKMGVDLVQAWADAPSVRVALSQPWGNAPVLRADLLQRWASTFTLRRTLEQGWNIFGVVQAELAQRWSITADLMRGVLDQGWDLRDRDLLRAELLQRWAIEADGAVLRYQVAVAVDGVAVGIKHCNIEGGLDQDVLSGELHLGTEDDFLRCRMGASAVVNITSASGLESFSFVITAPRITEAHGDTQYIVEAMSPAVLLGEPYADPITGELTGLASAIAATLAGSITLSWQTVDWEVPPSTWIASGETPLALLKTLAAAVGAAVQSLPDGSLVVVPEYQVSVNQWASATPDLSLVENMDFWTTGSTPELKSGYNRFVIGDQLTTANTLRLDEESISATVKIVRGYQTPWTGFFDLAHTGGDWVMIEPLGIEERQKTETIEIVAGAGRVQYPIYSRDLVEWGQINLGSITFAEDGSVQSSVEGESLLTITYTTRCRKWQVRDPRNEQLQLVVP